MDKDKIIILINDEIKKFVKDELDKEMKKLLHNSSSQSRSELINMMKDAMESVYKLLWMKRDFWKNDIK